MKRATVADVAKAAGVSVATVDRALTGRLPVRQDTAERIAQAAREVGFHAAALLSRQLDAHTVRRRVGLLLQRPWDPFYAHLGAVLESAVASTRRFTGTSSLDHWSAPDPDEIAERLLRLARRADAVAMVSPDHPTVTAAVEEVVKGGTPIFSLLSDFAFGVRTAYVGVDNKKAGRTAAWIIARGPVRSGKVVIFVGSPRFHGHELREIGFRSYFRENAPDFAVIETPATMEQAAIARDAMGELLSQHRDLVGCYVAGGGMEGAIEALRETAPDRRPMLVCCAYTPASREALIEGIVTAIVSEPVPQIGRRLVERVEEALHTPARSPSPQDTLPSDLLTPENL